MASKILIVTGMHRSGTSLMAHYLSECGLFMGDKLLDVSLNRSLTSYRGHHEDKDFLEFHKQVLRKKWINAFPTNGFRLPVQVGESDRRLALNLVESRTAIPQWGWKDPRTTLFLDFWNDVLENANYLFLLRNPLSVVDSLLRRGNEKHITRKPVNGLKVWRVYNQLILKFWTAHGDASVICNIDELICAPDNIRQQLEKKFGLELKEIALETVFSKQAFKTEYSDQIEQLKAQYPDEVSACMTLFQKLQAISKEQLHL